MTLRKLTRIGRDAEPFELRVLAAARALAADGDHRVVLPTDASAPEERPGELKIGLFGNLANNAYIFAKCLRRLGYDAELVIEDGWFDAFLLNRPFWEDVEAECIELRGGAHPRGPMDAARLRPPRGLRRGPPCPAPGPLLGDPRGAGALSRCLRARSSGGSRRWSWPSSWATGLTCWPCGSTTWSSSPGRRSGWRPSARGRTSCSRPAAICSSRRSRRICRVSWSARRIGGEPPLRFAK